MKFTLKSVTYAVFVTVTLCLPLVLTAQDRTDATIGDSALYEMTAGELSEILTGQDRFAPLPKNISNIYVSPQHPPCFRMSKEDYYKPEKLSTTLNTFRKHRKHFRLIIGGHVVGRGDNGEVAIADDKKLAGTILSAEGSKLADLPKGDSIERVFSVDGKWICQTATGFITVGGTPWGNAEDLLKNVRFIRHNGTILIIRANQVGSAGKRELRPLVIAIGTGEGLQRHTYRNLPFDRIEGMVECKDGRWLAVGSRLAFLKKDFDQNPPRSEIEEALKAAKEGRLKELFSHLERLTVFPNQSLASLTNSLLALPDSTAQFRSLLQQLRDTLNSLERFRLPSPRPSREAPLKKLADAIETCKGQTRQALRLLTEAGGDILKASPHRLSRLISQGYQYFDGRWISNPRLLLQESTKRVYLHLTYVDSSSERGKRGIFLLGDNGHLELICALKTLPPRHTALVLFRDNHARPVVFIRGHGLARIEQRKLVWLDQSERMRSMDSAIGCDMFGKFYFARQVHSAGFPGRCSLVQKWVFNPDGVAEQEAESVSLRVFNRPVLDTYGRVWFICEQSAVSALPAKSPFLKEVRDKPYTMAKAAGREDLGRRRFNALVLCCYDNGVLYRYFASSVLRSAELRAGADGAIIITSRTPAYPVYVIEDDVVYTAKNLHEMAEKHFDILAKVAPTCNPSSHPEEHGSRVSASGSTVVRVNDLLWVCDRNRVEVYRRGKTLFLNRRITLHGVKLDRPAIFGPFGSGQVKRILITCRPGRIDATFWATVGQEGISLERSQTPNSAWPGGGTLCHPGKFIDQPLIDRRRGLAYYYHGFDRIWQASGPNQYNPVPDAGQPVLVTRDGKLIVYRYARIYRGCRIVSDSSRKDIPLTYVKKLRPVFEEDDGRLLCLTPGGVVWLRPTSNGSYTISTKLNLVSPKVLIGYLGRSGGLLFFTARERSHIYVTIAKSSE